MEQYLDKVIKLLEDTVEGKLDWVECSYDSLPNKGIDHALLDEKFEESAAFYTCSNTLSNELTIGINETNSENKWFGFYAENDIQFFECDNESYESRLFMILVNIIKNKMLKQSIKTNKRETSTEVLKEYIANSRNHRYKWNLVEDTAEFCEKYDIKDGGRVFLNEQTVNGQIRKMYVIALKSSIHVVYEGSINYSATTSRHIPVIWVYSKGPDNFEQNYLIIALYTAVRLSFLKKEARVRKDLYINTLNEIEDNLEYWKENFHILSKEIADIKKRKSKQSNKNPYAYHVITAEEVENVLREYRQKKE